MKPRIFIGSSGQSKHFAEAIHAGLEDVAECTVWTAGAFGLSASTQAELVRNLSDSDFGIFVFAPDDDATIKGQLLKVPRDNVVYEAGLFSGFLGPERCFIVVPRNIDVHVPTDLAGMTKGFYDDSRTDGNNEAAVLTFCSKAKPLVRSLGLFHGDSAEELRDLVVRFECCERWIKDEQERVGTKRRITGDIETYVKNHSMNKHRLAAQRRTGYYIALFAAIRFHPAPRDGELILKLSTDKIPHGFAYYKLVDSIESLKATTNATQAQLKQLHDWVYALPEIGKYTDLTPRIDSLIV